MRTNGWLWNSFVIVADPLTLISMIESALPSLVAEFAALASGLGTVGEDESVRRLYASVAVADFSKDVLTAGVARLAVLPVKGVAWNDLGEARRVRTTLARIGIFPAWAEEPA